MLRSILMVATMTSVSRVLGLGRDIVFSRLFGAGSALDTFIVAFRIPNFLRRLFAEGSFSQAFVPVLAEYRERRDKAAMDALIDQTMASLGLVLILVTVIGIVLAPVLILLFAPGFLGHATKQILAVDMLRITFPYLLFISLTAFVSCILNVYQRFSVPAFTPVLLNLSLILCAVFLSPRMAEPVKALAWGVFFAGIGQLLFQLFFLYRLRGLPRPGLRRDPEGRKRIISLMLPAIFASSIVQINLLVDTLIASFLITGSISWLYFSDRLIEFPVGVFGVALATVILPNLAKQHVCRSPEVFSKMLGWGLRWVFLIALPAMVGLIILAHPLLFTLFQYQSFTAYDVQMTGKSLIAYALGITGFILVKLLASGFFSRQDTKTPMKIGAIVVLVNICLNIILVFPLAHMGLALATSLSAYVQAAILFYVLKRQGVLRHQSGWGVFFLRLVLALLMMALCLMACLSFFPDWSGWQVGRRIIVLTILVGAGIVVYFTSLWLLGMRIKDMTVRL